MNDTFRHIENQLDQLDCGIDKATFFMIQTKATLKKNLNRPLIKPVCHFVKKSGPLVRISPCKRLYFVDLHCIYL